MLHDVGTFSLRLLTVRRQSSHEQVACGWCMSLAQHCQSWVPRIAHMDSIPPVGQCGLASGAKVCEPRLLKCNRQTLMLMAGYGQKTLITSGPFQSTYGSGWWCLLLPPMKRYRMISQPVPHPTVMLLFLNLTSCQGCFEAHQAIWRFLAVCQSRKLGKIIIFCIIRKPIYLYD